MTFDIFVIFHDFPWLWEPWRYDVGEMEERHLKKIERRLLEGEHIQFLVFLVSHYPKRLVPEIEEKATSKTVQTIETSFPSCIDQDYKH